MIFEVPSNKSHSMILWSLTHHSLSSACSSFLSPLYVTLEDVSVRSSWPVRSFSPFWTTSSRYSSDTELCLAWRYQHVCDRHLITGFESILTSEAWFFSTSFSTSPTAPLNYFPKSLNHSSSEERIFKELLQMCPLQEGSQARLKKSCAFRQILLGYTTLQQSTSVWRWWPLKDDDL